ncbi:3'-5' exonuclease [Limnothrix sp. FACHB-1083]|uniref:3'-5' exonuclease n=1 Tax=unclassified Limnothrix TaxID=2632864 RepID=UPI00168148FD|nr:MULTISPECIES: 3'-5' exonuclease [unclassified Limnothrix]MBD2160401.1 3'-5' exonuclease [Limnothrix sp. FACHB-1083]MBD2191102.1 3'-5' exonuclease [Limnothrix sp. FACHB-1088]
MNLLLIDTETTGVTTDDHALEVSATLYHIGEVSGAVASVSTLLPSATNPAWSVNKIDPALTQVESAQDWALRYLRQLAELADYWVAFNAEFDRPFFKKAVESESSKPWLCAYSDFEWTADWIRKPQSQIALSLSMGVGVLHAHRAGDDVRTLVACLDRLGDRLPAVVQGAITRTQSERVTVVALVGYDNRQLAKNAGFWWKDDRKQWIRQIRHCDLQSDWVKALPFDLQVIP